MTAAAESTAKGGPKEQAVKGEGARLSLARWLFSPLAGVTFGDWAKLLGRYGTDISPVYYPRTGFTIGMSLLNSALAGGEARRHGAAVAAAEVKAPVFVLGHHRSGTTHLWNLLSQDGTFAYPTVLQAVFPHTFLTFESAVHGLAQRFAPRKRPQDNVAFSPDAPIEEERAICAASFLSIQMARHFPQMRDRFKPYLSMKQATAEERARWKETLDTFARKLLVRHGTDKRLLFKAPDHTAKVALILEQFPDARFINIHRHPYEVYRSTVKMERDTLPLYAYQRPDEEGLEDYVIWRYRAMYDAYLEDRAQVPEGQIADVAYKDLDADPLGTLERLYADLDLGDFAEARPALERYIDSLSGYRKNTYKELPEEIRTRLAEAWAPVFSAWGYTP